MMHQFVGGANDAFSIGLLPAASFAFGANWISYSLMAWGIP